MRNRYLVLIFLATYVLLWDWPIVYLYIIAGSALIVGPLAYYLIENAKARGDDLQFPRFASCVESEVAEFWRWILFGIIFLNWFLILLAILGHRENLFNATSFFAPVIAAAAFLFPLIDFLPNIFQNRGFEDRGTIVQVVASIGITAALCVTIVMGYLQAVGISKLDKVAPSASSVRLCLAAILMLPIAYLVICFLLLPIPGQNRKGAIMFDGFIYSDLSLLLRFWIWPTVLGFLVSWSLATPIRRLRFGRHDEQNIYQVGGTTSNLRTND